MKSVEIDRTKLLRDQPATGHNRLHPDIPPILEVDEGEEVVLETRDGCDGYLGPSATAASIATMDAGAVHPLTGPVLVKGARPGDVLEIEMVDILPQPHAFTAIVPGLGFLRDLYTTPYLVKWRIADGWATSPELPGVRIPGRAVHGRDRRRALARSGSRVDRARAGVASSAAGSSWCPMPPAPSPARGGWRRRGSARSLRARTAATWTSSRSPRARRCPCPVTVEGALFSVGDGHFAQGDGEVCVTAVEMGATAVVRFRVLKGAAKKPWRGPRFSHRDYFAPPEWAAPKHFIAATGMPIRDDGVNEGENLTLACRNALLNMIDLLQERGWTREQAYVICSVAADLRISNVVDVPNYVVSALLPEAIFQG